MIDDQEDHDEIFNKIENESDLKTFISENGETLVKVSYHEIV